MKVNGFCFRTPPQGNGRFFMSYKETRRTSASEAMTALTHILRIAVLGITVFGITVLCITVLVSARVSAEEKPAIKALILPKFEVDKISGDFPGEAQYYYEGFLEGGDEYDIPFGPDNYKLYVKDGVALAVTGMGKVNAALSAAGILSDDRFDFSDAYVISTGCAGSARDTTVMGDVFLITSAVDFDLGHHADIRDMENKHGTTWFHDENYDDAAYVPLDPGLMDRAFELIKDVPLRTTGKTRNYMRSAFDGADWALRDPKVSRGTTVSGDNYWKGDHDHDNALAIVDTYGCPDPYATTEMEDIAIAQAMKHLGMLDRLIIIRGSVNMDVFMLGNTPETLWAPETSDSVSSDDSVEAADIFPVSMENTFKVGKVIIDAILDGSF